MSEQTAEQIAATAAATAAAAAAADSKPPWGDDFDAGKAWKLIEDLRGDKEKLAKRPTLTAEQQTKLAEYERLEQASQTELQRQTAETTRWQSEAEKWRTASVASRIEVLASAAEFADPSDAVAALADPGKYLDAGGVVDEAAIKADLEAVLQRKPHWRRAEGTTAPRVPAPNSAQGSGGSAAANPAAELAAIIQGQLRR